MQNIFYSSKAGTTAVAFIPGHIMEHGDLNNINTTMDMENILVVEEDMVKAIDQM